MVTVGCLQRLSQTEECVNDTLLAGMVESLVLQMKHGVNIATQGLINSRISEVEIKTIKLNPDQVVIGDKSGGGSGGDDSKLHVPIWSMGISSALTRLFEHHKLKLPFQQKQ